MKVAEGVHRIDGISGNVYLLTDGTMTLIDTGMPGSGPKIASFMKNELHTDIRNIAAIVITHQHIDHAGSALWLRNATGARIAVHDMDAAYVSGERKPLRPRGAIGAAFALFSPFFRLKTFSPDLLLQDGERVGPLRVMHIPGHTPGSIALFNDEMGIAFSGDIVSNRNGKLAYPPPAFNYDEEEMKGSFSRLLSQRFSVLLPGHGEPIYRQSIQRFAGEGASGAGVAELDNSM